LSVEEERAAIDVLAANYGSGDLEDEYVDEEAYE